MAWRFCSNVVKGLKLKVRKFWGLVVTFGKVITEKTEGDDVESGDFFDPLPFLKRVITFLSSWRNVFYAFIEN